VRCAEGMSPFPSVSRELWMGQCPLPRIIFFSISGLQCKMHIAVDPLFSNPDLLLHCKTLFISVQ